MMVGDLAELIGRQLQVGELFGEIGPAEQEKAVAQLPETAPASCRRCEASSAAPAG